MEDLKQLNERVVRVEERVGALEKDFDIHLAKVNSIDNRLDKIEKLIIQIRAVLIVLIAVVVILKYGFLGVIKALW